MGFVASIVITVSSHGVGMLSPLGMASQHGYGAIEMDDDKIPNAVVGRGITILQFLFLTPILDSLNPNIHVVSSFQVKSW